jgi:hypothetical protein
MASKTSSPGLNTTTTPAPKASRSRKAANLTPDAGRAGSAGGILLDKPKVAKPTKTSPVPKVPSTQDTTATPRRKPRKLNKDPTPAPTAPVKDALPTPEPTEIEALKSRVRGLEAKVEELYKSGSLERPGRSPRRRGKGRKSSAAQGVPTLTSAAKASVADDNDDDDDVEEIIRSDDPGVQELVQLEGELEVARRDLDAFRPLDDGDEDVEEIQRDSTAGGSGGGNRHVTLSGSYRIPLPSSVSVSDVKNIQSGVSAAQNVARSFLEQRRAANASVKGAASSSTTPARPAPKSVSSSLTVTTQDDGDKKSWSEWIGGYSVAISRAVGKIEHEAAVESGRVDTGRKGGGGGSGKKRAGVRAQGDGLTG